MAIKSGSKVKIEYEGTLDDGSVFDSSSKQGKPLEFTLGQNQVIPGFEKAVLEMEKGEEKKIKIEAKDAYGERNDALTKKFPKTNLPENLSPKKGMILGLQSPDGRQIPALISDVTETDVTLDLNHPLAGQNLNFKLKVLEVESTE
jgi:FKBP-type peptidyl-prolyl cis-trans isomerase 2